MTDAQKIKLGFILLAAQCILLVMTLGFKACLDHQAERAGIAAIITEATR
jgi:hypothetical protein